MKRSCLVLVLLGLGGCSNPEPLYNGQPLDYWIAAAIHSDKPTRERALIELHIIKDKDQRVVPKLVQRLSLGSYAAAEALGALARFGDQDGEAVKGLTDALKTDNLSVRFAAARALPKFGDAAGAAIPVLVQMLQDDSVDIRRQAAETLGNLNQNIPVVVDALHRTAVHDANVSVQRSVADALRKLDPQKWGENRP